MHTPPRKLPATATYRCILYLSGFQLPVGVAHQMTSSAPKSEALRILYWRSEILRVVYWLYGEGLGDVVDVDLIRQYLGLDAQEDAVDPTSTSSSTRGHSYATAPGSPCRPGALAEGEAQRATAFTDLVRPIVNECNDECWCQTSAGGGRGVRPRLAARRLRLRPRQERPLHEHDVRHRQRHERHPAPALPQAVPPAAAGRGPVPRLRAARARPPHGHQGRRARRALPLPAGHGEGGDGVLLVGAVPGRPGAPHLCADRARTQAGLNDSVQSLRDVREILVTLLDRYDTLSTEATASRA